jgi:hypothetical protein
MNQAWPVTSKILGEYQRDQQVDQQREGNQPAQDIRPRHFFFSSAAQPATNPSVSNKKAMIAAVYTRSMSTPRIEMRTSPGAKIRCQKVTVWVEKQGRICRWLCKSGVKDDGSRLLRLDGFRASKSCKILRKTRGK